jgi:hypothetical protein
VHPVAAPDAGRAGADVKRRRADGLEVAYVEKGKGEQVERPAEFQAHLRRAVRSLGSGR